MHSTTYILLWFWHVEKQFLKVLYKINFIDCWATHEAYSFQLFAVPFLQFIIVMLYLKKLQRIVPFFKE